MTGENLIGMIGGPENTKLRVYRRDDQTVRIELGGTSIVFAASYVGPLGSMLDEAAGRPRVLDLMRTAFRVPRTPTPPDES